MNLPSSGLESVWLYTGVSVLAIGALSALGVLTLVVARRTLERWLLVLISFATGALLGDAFLHLIPEIAESESGFDLSASFGVLGGLIAFFILEKILHWHHSHIPREEVLHPVAITNLIGDGLHNFIDGAIVAGAYLVSTKIGIATTIAVALHEIPQEIGDFGILVHAGLKPKRALALNLLSALTALAGAAITLLISASVGGVVPILIPVTAGGFIYIASSDLIPELHKEPEAGKSIVTLAGLLAGVAVMASLLILE